MNILYLILELFEQGAFWGFTVDRRGILVVLMFHKRLRLFDTGCDHLFLGFCSMPWLFLQYEATS